MKKQTLAIFMLVIAVILLALIPILHDAVPKSVGGVMLGMGGGLLAAGISTLAQARQAIRHPEIQRQNDIEANDERNQMIRNRAQAQAGRVVQWLILALAFAMILLDLPLWLTLVTILVYLSFTVIWMVLAARYQKQM
jgi:hypothetical protein